MIDRFLPRDREGQIMVEAGDGRPLDGGEISSPPSDGVLQDNKGWDPTETGSFAQGADDVRENTRKNLKILSEDDPNVSTGEHPIAEFEEGQREEDQRKEERLSGDLQALMKRFGAVRSNARLLWIELNKYLHKGNSKCVSAVSIYETGEHPIAEFEGDQREKEGLSGDLQALMERFGAVRKNARSLWEELTKYLPKDDSNCASAVSIYELVDVVELQIRIFIDPKGEIVDGIHNSVDYFIDRSGIRKFLFEKVEEMAKSVRGIGVGIDKLEVIWFRSMVLNVLGGLHLRLLEIYSEENRKNAIEKAMSRI